MDFNNNMAWNNTHIGLVICTWFVFSVLLITIWCTYDGAGKSWVKMKRYQANMKEFELKYPTYKRSGTFSRNWRQRFVFCISSSLSTN